MKNTIITGAAAIALAAPAFAGAPAPYVAPEAPSELGLSGDISLTYQNQYDFRGVSGALSDAAGLLTSGAPFSADTDHVVIADINADYAFTENFSLVAGARVNTLTNTSIDHDTYRFGAVWKTDCYSIEAGYQYQDLRTVVGNLHTDELYLNLGTVCPWTGADINFFWAHALGGLEGDLMGTSVSTDFLDGDYLELNAHKSWMLNDWSAVDLTLGVSYSVDYWSQGSDWNNWYASLALPLAATEYLTVTPYVTYTDGLGATENIFGTGIDEGGEFLYGIKASVNF